MNFGVKIPIDLSWTVGQNWDDIFGKRYQVIIDTCCCYTGSWPAINLPFLCKLTLNFDWRIPSERSCCCCVKSAAALHYPKDALELSRQANHAEQACFTKIGNTTILVGKIGIPIQDTILIITIVKLIVITILVRHPMCVKVITIGPAENMGLTMCLLPWISMHLPMHRPPMPLDLVIIFMVLLITIMPTVTWGKRLAWLGHSSPFGAIARITLFFSSNGLQFFKIRCNFWL